MTLRLTQIFNDAAGKDAAPASLRNMIELPTDERAPLTATFNQTEEGNGKHDDNTPLSAEPVVLKEPATEQQTTAPETPRSVSNLYEVLGMPRISRRKLG